MKIAIGAIAPDLFEIKSEKNSKKTEDENLYENCFEDVEDEWFAPYVCYAKEKGWVTGYPDGTFKPENNVKF